MKEFTVTLTGTLPLLMHNPRLADPLDPAAKLVKKYSSKRNKTDDDHLALAEAEFMGGLYMDPDIGPFIPGMNIHAMLRDGGRLNKLGRKVIAGVLITKNVNPLAYNGPRTEQALWEDGRFTYRASVVVTRQRITRTRPLFAEWIVEAPGVYDPAQIDLDQIRMIADNAGMFVGLGDSRPRFGRFTAKVEEGK
jgi:hypothetical protein